MELLCCHNYESYESSNVLISEPFDDFSSILGEKIFSLNFKDQYGANLKPQHIF